MPPPVDIPPSNYRLSDLTLDVARRSVTREGQRVELKALDFDLLRFLVESAPNVVNADALAEKVWSRHFVSPENVAQRVMLLRQSLSDDANKPRYIETVRNKGYRLIPIVESAPAEESGTARRRRWPAAIAAALLLGITATASYWVAGREDAERPLPIPGSVAVLPFENPSPSPEGDVFAVGMQDQIVNQLTKIRSLRVIPIRPRAGEHRAIPEVARDLNVATVLAGSVYYSEGRVRVTPRLTDGKTGVSLWADSYERERSDIFAIQSDIALDVAQALSLELSAAERERVQRVPTANPQARELYFMAMARDSGSDEVLLAIDEIEQALALDPEFKEAWVARSIIHSGAQIIEPRRAEEHREIAEQAARRALELDPEFGDGYFALGYSLASRNDWTGAESAFRRALSLNRPFSEMGSYAFLQLSVGKFEPLARDIFEAARAAQPRGEIFYRFLMFVYEGSDRERASALYESSTRLFGSESEEAVRRRTQRMHWLVAHNDLAKARAIQIDDALNAAMLARLDTPEQALAELRNAHEATGTGNPNRNRDIGLWAGYFGNPELAFAAMRTMADEGGGRMAYVWMPQLKAMRRLPEFKAYLREIGMVDYWEEYGFPDICRQLGEDDFECD
jgi:TolB-like protein/DNA-binding winged helix-turn-helix (wHTH) protein